MHSTVALVALLFHNHRLCFKEEDKISASDGVVRQVFALLCFALSLVESDSEAGEEGQEIWGIGTGGGKA